MNENKKTLDNAVAYCKNDAIATKEIIEETKESKIKMWFKAHKTVIFGFCAYTLGCVVTGLLAQRRTEYVGKMAYIRGVNDEARKATFGFDAEKNIVFGYNVYDYGGYGELHDCDPETAEGILNFVEAKGYTENDMDMGTIRKVVFVEMNKKNGHDQAK